jgi:hypothetical protein
MTVEETYEYIVAVIGSYDPLYGTDAGTDEWIDSDVLDREISMVIRTLINELRHDEYKLLGRESVEH